MSATGEVYGTALPMLSMEDTRDEIHSRLIGPLNAIAVIHAIDAYRESGELQEAAEAVSEAYDTSVQGMTRYDDFTRALNEGLGRRVRHGIMHKVHQGEHSSTSLTRGQTNMLDMVTAGGELEGNVSEGTQAQINATLRLAYPAILIARQNLSSAPQVLDVAKAVGLEGVATVMRERAFPRMLSRLGATANRMYERTEVKQYVDEPDQYPALTLRNIVNRYAVTDPEAMPDDVSLYNLLSADHDGNYTITPEAHKVLKYYLKYSNSLRPKFRLGKLTSASRGCPLLQRTAEINRGDYTDQQWSALTEGENPIASSSMVQGKHILRFERPVFDELNNLLADVIDPIDNKTEQKA